MKKIICIICCFCLIMNTLTGCGKENVDKTVKEEPVHVSLIIQPIETAPMVNLSAVEEILKNVCCIPGSSLNIIVADGMPWKYLSVEPDEIDPAFSNDMKEQIINERIHELYTVIVSAKARNKETDLRKAIEMGAKELHSYRDNIKKQIVVCGPFINTVVPLPMQEIFLSRMDVEAVNQNLMEESYIIDLEDISIVGYYLGSTYGKQKELSNTDKEKLKEFWMKYFETGNAAEIMFMDDLPGDNGYEDVPEVSLLPVTESGSALQNLKQEEIKNVDAVVFDQEAVAFYKGRAELMDKEKARKSVKELAEYMRNTNAKALLVGGTAKWGDLEGQYGALELSFQRGMVVKNLFIDEGVPYENLVVLGTGWLSCLYKDDQQENGELNETYASMNRACTWISSTSELADQIMNDEDYDQFIVE